jgi:NAD(P)-dependent dehydrogenase (short-subunit alcohol dehydrogenase family)
MNAIPKIALVTGAGRQTGIGYEVAAQLAANGFIVMLTERDGPTAAARAKELSGHVGQHILARELDVTSEHSVREAASAIEHEFGRLDVLVNNAALLGTMGERAVETDLRAAHQVMDVNLFGAWRLTQALLPLLRRSAHARVVNVSSGAGSHNDAAFGLSTHQLAASYAISKAGLNALTAKFAAEERPHRVLVNAVCPGFTATLDGMREAGARPVSEGAASVVWAALLDDDGPSGGFFRDGKPIAW